MVLPYINMNLPGVYTCSPSWTPLPPPSPYHRSGSSQCTSQKHPVSCIKPGLAICFLYDIWNAKVGSLETPGVTGKFGLGVQNEAGQTLIEFWWENALVIANTLFQQHKRRLYTWTSPDGQHRNQIVYIISSQRWRSSIQSAETRPGADWLRSWTPYWQIQTEIEESGENH